MKPCKKHPDAERYESGACKRCGRERAAKWYAENRGRALANFARWRSENHDKALANTARWRMENKERTRANRARWRVENPDREKAGVARWRAANKDRRYALSVRWKAENPDMVRDHAARYYEAHKDRIKAYVAQWCTENHEAKLVRNSKRRARRLGATVPLTSAESASIIALYAKASEMTRQTGLPYHVDHVRPLVKGGLHHPDNLQILLGSENCKKGARWQ